MANQRFYADLRTLQKRANQRLVRLEQADIESPAYRAVQAQLEVLGRSSKTAAGRRFSETGKATYNEYEMQKAILVKFLGQTTSMVKGAMRAIEQSYGTANIHYRLADLGITKEQWGEFWQNFPANKKDRMFYEQSVKIFKAVIRRQGQPDFDETEYTPAEIAQAIQEGVLLTNIYDKLNLDWQSVEAEETPFFDPFTWENK